MCDKCGCGENQKEKTLQQKVEDLIQAIRPNLQSHGGDIEFINLEDDNTVKVKLQGAAGCPGARMTLKNGVEALLKEHLPEIKEVVAVD